jgi:hypothetical protein
MAMRICSPPEKRQFTFILHPFPSQETPRQFQQWIMNENFPTTEMPFLYKMRGSRGLVQKGKRNGKGGNRKCKTYRAAAIFVEDQDAALQFRTGKIGLKSVPRSTVGTQGKMEPSGKRSNPTGVVSEMDDARPGELKLSKMFGRCLAGVHMKREPK